MDTSNLLDYLVMVSNNNMVLNLGMHLLVLISIVSIYLLKDIKLRKYMVEGTVLLLCLSVTTNALIFGNPFHAVTFGIMTLIAVLVMVKGKNDIGMPQADRKSVV